MSRGRRKRAPEQVRAAKSVKPVFMNRGHAVALIVLTAVGFLTSAYLTYLHYRHRLEPGWASACDFSEIVSCDRVVTSSYGSIGSVPWSAVGLWFYALAAVLAAIDLRPVERVLPRSTAPLLLAAAATATATSLALAVASFSLGAVCPLCVALYVVNGLMLGVAWRATRLEGQPSLKTVQTEWKHWRRHPERAVLYSVAAALPLLVMTTFYRNDAVARSVVCVAVDEHLSGEDAYEPIALIIYSDFQCPHCRALELSLRSLRGKPGIRIVQRHFPLDATCNPRAKYSPHPGSCLLARAAICAGEQGRLEKLTDILFDSKAKSLEDALIAANAVGIDRELFEACLRSGSTETALAESIQAAIADGVQSTPVTLIGGHRKVGTLNSHDLGCLARVAG